MFEANNQMRVDKRGLVNVLIFTSPKYWGYNLQEIFESDVKQIPKP